MDRYTVVTRVPDFNSIPGRARLARNIWDSIQRGGTICVYGKHGCGKTFLLQKILGNNYFEYDSINKSDTHSHVVVENITNEILDTVKTNGSLTQGTTIFVCEDVKKIDFCNCFEVPVFTEEELNTLFPGHPRAARLCEGNMWNFEFYKQFSDQKDVFMTPKDYVTRIMSQTQESYIKSSVEEHGHTWGMIHENYQDSRGITMDECADIGECMSLTDIIDQRMYENDWGLFEFFQVAGIATPAYIINGRHRGTIRPGSSWTKMNNQKMRASKLRKFKPVHHEKLNVLLDVMMKSESPEDIARDYNITSGDIDVLNHLKIHKKFKPSEVARLKKRISCRATS